VTIPVGSARLWKRFTLVASIADIERMDLVYKRFGQSERFPTQAKIWLFPFLSSWRA